jgi:hypothetical protein
MPPPRLHRRANQIARFAVNGVVKRYFTALLERRTTKIRTPCDRVRCHRNPQRRTTNYRLKKDSTSPGTRTPGVNLLAPASVRVGQKEELGASRAGGGLTVDGGVAVSPSLSQPNQAAGGTVAFGAYGNGYSCTLPQVGQVTLAFSSAICSLLWSAIHCLARVKSATFSKPSEGGRGTTGNSTDPASL